jgi:hypothetical protein
VPKIDLVVENEKPKKSVVKSMMEAFEENSRRVELI